MPHATPAATPFVLAIGLNSAWQRILLFDELLPGQVNRARRAFTLTGGKAVNAAAAVRRLGGHAVAVLVAGGATGRLIRRDLARRGIPYLCVTPRAATRVCSTLLATHGEPATELIEPSPPLAPAALACLERRLAPRVARCAGIALCGTRPPGVPAAFYARVAAAAPPGAPVILDAVNEVEPTLAAGVDLLKVNAGELAQLSGCENPAAGARALQARFPLRWIACTAGAGDALLLGAEGTWRFVLPRLPRVVNPIGGGDCVTGVLLWRLAGDDAAGKARRLAPEQLVPAFRDALACACASCLEAAPAAFAPARARALAASIRIVPPAGRP